jgi:hypothetical protein
VNVPFAEERLIGCVSVRSVGGWFVTCFVDAIGLCSDCEETWEAEEDLDFQ